MEIQLDSSINSPFVSVTDEGQLRLTMNPSQRIEEAIRLVESEIVRAVHESLQSLWSKEDVSRKFVEHDGKVIIKYSDVNPD